MERLTIDEVIEHCKRHTDRVEGRNSQEILEKAKIGDYGMKEYWEHRQVAKWLEKLKAYEQAEEDGLLIRLPVAEGSEVYVIDYVYECKYEFECPLPYNEYKCEEELPCENQYKRYRVRETKFNHMMLAKIGKTVFLSKALD